MDREQPKSWDDVPLAAYQLLAALPKDMPEVERSVASVAILTDSTPRDVRRMKAADYAASCETLAFTRALPDPRSWRRTLELGGVTYGFLPSLDALTLGEVIDMEEHVADWSGSLHRLMALLYRPVTKRDGDSYEVEPYDGASMERRAALFAEEMSAQDAYGASLFFCLIATGCLGRTSRSSGTPRRRERNRTT